MSYLVPKSYWSSPFLNVPSLLEDEDWGMLSNMPNGLSLSEDDKSVYVECALPGLDPKEVEVTFERGVLRVVGQHVEEKNERKYSRKQQSHFSYQVVLPESADMNTEPKAEMKQGILHLTFSKSPKMQPKRISIK